VKGLSHGLYKAVDCPRNKVPPIIPALPLFLYGGPIICNTFLNVLKRASIRIEGPPVGPVRIYMKGGQLPNLVAVLRVSIRVIDARLE